MSEVSELKKKELALRNIRSFVRLKHREIPKDIADVILRFCEEGGVRDTILRGEKQ